MVLCVLLFFWYYGFLCSSCWEITICFQRFQWPAPFKQIQYRALTSMSQSSEHQNLHDFDFLCSHFLSFFEHAPGFVGHVVPLVCCILYPQILFQGEFFSTHALTVQGEQLDLAGAKWVAGQSRVWIPTILGLYFYLFCCLMSQLLHSYITGWFNTLNPRCKTSMC